MSIIKKFNEFINEEFFFFNLPDKELSELVPESKIYELFKKYGYDAFDVEYSSNNLEICVSPKSFKFKGEFSNEFSNEMKSICEEIGANDFDLSHSFQVTFYFDDEKHQELIKK